MAVTASSDIANWIPSVVSTSVYDTMYASDRPLTQLAAVFDEMDGTEVPGSTFYVPTLGITTPADDLAETVPAVDDKLSGTSVGVTVKEAVKSIAWYDRTRVASGQDFNQLAGSRVGGSIADRVELDLGAAIVAGRNTGADTAAAAMTIAQIRAMRAKIPVGMRRRGQLVLLAEQDVLDQLLADPITQNAATFGSDEAIRDGDFSRPLAGVRLQAVDTGTLPIITATKATALMVVVGTFVRAFVKQPATEVERDARARLTRVVGTAMHGEGVIDSRGIVGAAIG